METKPAKWKATQRMSKGAFEINFYRDKDFKTVRMHSHDFFELYFFIGGVASYIVENKRYKLRYGDILLISPSDLHQLDIADTAKTYERFVLWLSQGYLQSLGTTQTDLSECFIKAAENKRYLIRNAAVAEEVKKKLTALYGLSSNNGFGDDVEAELIVKGVLLTLCRFMRDTETGERDESEGVIGAAIDYINSDLSGELTLEKLSEKFFLSKYYFARLFKSQTSMSVHQYILKKRLIMSKHYIKEGIPISQVCIRCGFADYSNFFRAFKNEYGITPKQYLKMEQVG